MQHRKTTGWIDGCRENKIDVCIEKIIPSVKKCADSLTRKHFASTFVQFNFLLAPTLFAIEGEINGGGTKGN